MVAAKNDVQTEICETTPLLEEQVGTVPDHARTDKDREVSAVVIWLILPILLAGVFLSNVVSSVVLATSQQIASDFDALSSAAWLLTTYSLAQSASQPLYGKLSNVFGRRACLIFCWVVFAIGCLLVGLGQTYWQVLLGRAIGGVGSAGKIALASIVIADLVPLRHVATYRAYVNLTATTGRSIGGPIGGWLAGSVGWRWCFIAQMPLAIVGLALVLWKLPEPAQKCPPEQNFDTEKASKLSRVDFAGAITLVGTILLGLLTLDLAAKGVSHLVAIGLACTFLTFAAAFTCVEKYYAKEPILPLDLVLRRDVLTSYLILGFQAAGQFGLLYGIPVYFQVVQHESVSSASTRIVPVVVGNTLGTIVSARLISRTKRYKLLTAVGNLAGLFGFSLIFARWQGHTGLVDSFFVVFPGMGMGILQSATFVHLAASLEQSEIAIAGTSWFLAQNIGALTGASLSMPLINHILLERLMQGLREFSDRPRIISKVTSNVQSIAALPDDVRIIVEKAYVRALQGSTALSLSFVALALIVTFTMRERPL